MTREEEDQRAKASDNVVRAEKFRAAHPEVTILWPGQNETGEFLATWVEVSADPADDGTPRKANERDLGRLMNYLEALFNDR